MDSYISKLIAIGDGILKVNIITSTEIKYGYLSTPRHAYGWAKYLLEHRVDTTLLLPDKIVGGNPPIREDYKEVEKYYSMVPKKRIKDHILRYGFGHTTNLYTQLPKDGITFFPMMLYDYLPNILLKPKGQKYVIGCWGMYIFKQDRVSQNELLENTVNLFFQNFVLRRKELRENIFYQAINHRQERYLLKLGIPKKKIFYVPNWIDTEKFHIRKPSGKKLKVVHVGGIPHSSGMILDMIKQIATDGKANEFEFYFIGRYQPEELLEYAKKMDNVTCTGPITDEEKAKILSRCDVMVVPEILEAFSVAMLEGLSNGLAIIVDDYNPVIDELINDGAMAYKGNKDDIQSYVKALMKVAKMKKSKGFGRAKNKNREIVVRKFDRKVVLSQVKEMFVKVNQSGNK